VNGYERREERHFRSDRELASTTWLATIERRYVLRFDKCECRVERTRSEGTRRSLDVFLASHVGEVIVDVTKQDLS
jgi:hypothetical protein